MNILVPLTYICNSQKYIFLTSNKIKVFNLIKVHLSLQYILMSFNTPWPQNYNYNKTLPQLLLAWHNKIQLEMPGKINYIHEHNQTERI
jgi:hypothetical protein